MATEHTLYLLMYDITNRKILQKVAKLVQQHGYERINYSVWIGNNNPLKHQLLKESLNSLLTDEHAQGSNFFVIPVSRKDISRMKSYTGKKPRNLDYWLGEKHTMFL
ncbi:CRISPR-associated endonuclease Cas2 [Prolixibacteraceae bacterium JC049]|nr:CRISPR-associated endonuclease Cas2 [Prolixibacteraceae bacterium JC049]